MVTIILISLVLVSNLDDIIMTDDLHPQQQSQPKRQKRQPNEHESCYNQSPYRDAGEPFHQAQGSELLKEPIRFRHFPCHSIHCTRCGVERGVCLRHYTKNEACIGKTCGFRPTCLPSCNDNHAVTVRLNRSWPVPVSY